VIALLAVEIRRFLSRRVVRLMALLALAAILVAGVIVFVRSHPPSPGDLARAEAEQEAFREACLRGEFGIPSPGTPGAEVDLEEFCNSIGFEVLPDDTRFRLTSLTNVFKGTTVPLVLLAWVLAASYIGADWHSGTVATTLTWEPRRIRLQAGKAAACLALTVLGYLILQTLLGLALYPAAAARGITEGANGAWVAETARVLLRGASLAAIGAALGFSIASVARNTAAGVGLGFAYVVIAESLLSGLLPRITKWLVVPNAVILVGGPQGEIPGRTILESGLLLGAYALGALVAATALFRVRDVT
jgi:ABC-2 type transport system permease protein